MSNQNKLQNKTFIVFNMKYASKLIQLGHKVIQVMPNPKNVKLSMWEFALDETFEEDFERIRRGGI